MYSIDGWCSGFSEIRISASMPPTLSLGTKARLNDDGTPMVSLMVSSLVGRE